MGAAVAMQTLKATSFKVHAISIWGRGQACTCLSLFLVVVNFVSLQVQGKV